MINSYLLWEKNLALFFGHFSNQPLDWLFLIISYLGELGFIWWVIVLFCLIYDKKNGKRIFILFLIILGLHLFFINIIFHGLIYRPRPFVELLLVQKQAKLWLTSSFPSGHMVFGTACAILFSNFYPRFKIPLIIFVILTAFSRIYLEMHYLSDVLAGIAIGVIFGIFVLYLNKKVFIK